MFWFWRNAKTRGALVKVMQANAIFPFAFENPFTLDAVAKTGGEEKPESLLLVE